MPYQVLHLITSLDEGGAENILARYIPSSSSAYRHVVVCIKHPGTVANKLLSQNITVYSLAVTKNPFTLISGTLRWLRIVIRFKPIIIHSWLYHANLLSTLTAFFFPFYQVWGIHNSNLYESQQFNPTFLISRLLGKLARFSSPYIIYCAESAEYFHQHYLGFPSTNKSTVIVNGVINYSKETGQLSSRNSSMPSNVRGTITFGCIARYHPVKNHALLLSAFAIALQEKDNLELVLAGSGVVEDNERLNFLLDTLNIRHCVSLLGHRQDIVDLMTSFDFLVLSSRSEAFPSVLIESMMLGSPCISTDVGDARQIIGDTGWVCPTINPYDLAKCLVSAASCDSQRYAELSRACFLRASTYYSLDLMTKKYDELYERILN